VKQWNSPARRQPRDDTRSFAINGKSKLPLVFGTIDCGIGRWIYDQIRREAIERLWEARGFRQIEDRAIGRNQVAKPAKRASKRPANLPRNPRQDNAHQTRP
jgi:hypothetical protein